MSPGRGRGAHRRISGCLTMLTLCALQLACTGRSPLEEIARLEDTRNPDGGRLVAYLAHPGAGVRARAARAAGRLQLPSLAGALVPLLNDEDPAVVQAVLFALGQIALGELRPSFSPPSSAGCLSTVPSTPSRGVVQAPGRTRDEIARVLAPRAFVSRTTEEETARELAAALGKTASERAVDALAFMVRDPRPAVRVEAIAALGRRPGTLGVPLVLPLLADSVAEVRWNAARVLARRGPGIVPALLPLVQDPHPEVRAAAVRALGLAGGAPDSASAGAQPHSTILWHLQHGELDSEVQVAALTALGRLHASESLPTIGRYLHALWPQVRAAAAIALAEFPDETAADLIRLTEDANPLVRLAAIQGLARGTSPGTRERLLDLASAPEVATRRAACTALMSLDGTLGQARALLSDLDPLVRCAAVHELAERGDTGDLELVLTRVGDSDLVVATEAVAGAAALSRRHREAQIVSGPTHRMPAPARGQPWPSEDYLLSLYRPGAATPVRRVLAAELSSDPRIEPLALVPLLRDPDPAVRREVFASCANRLPPSERSRVPARDLVESRARPLEEASSPLDADDLPRRAEVVTAGGYSFVIRLHARLAPRTVANFVRLARSGYFEGQRFFRVVPDSVVVTGCPRGDGFGGPGYTIRCEVNPARFERGSVAMLADGKDSGGSCLFITLTPQPELDGLYTVFGTVVQGMALVDGLGVGARISKVIVG